MRAATPPAVVVSAGRQGLAVTRALGEAGVQVIVVYSDPRDLAHVSRHAQTSILVPRPDDGTDAFVTGLLQLGDMHPGSVLIPTGDDSLKDVSSAKSELSSRFRVACPSYADVMRCVDKPQTYVVAARAGVAAPTSSVPHDADEACALGVTIGYPCLVKPSQSHLYVERFHRKVTVVHDEGAMRRAFLEADAASLDVMVQQLIDGPDPLGVNYNAFRHGGRVIAECTARKVRLAPPRYGVPRVVQSRAVPEVLEQGRALLDALNLEGFACTEFKLDPRTGIYHLLEVNVRHNRSGLLSLRSGINFPLLTYLTALGADVPPQGPAREGLFWIDELPDVIRSATRGGRDGVGLQALVHPWLSSHVFAVYDPTDRAPFFRDLRAVPDRGVESLRRREARGDSSA